MTNRYVNDPTPERSQFSIEWRDSGKKPRCAPDPEYPKGIDLNCAEGAEASCICELPYPAKGIGMYIVKCKICGMAVGCTTAGRSDDPRSIELPCKEG